VTLVLFDDQYEMVYEDMALSSVSDLTTEVYYTRGMTRLHDAVGKTISSVKERHGKAAPDKTMFLIIIDGIENDSREYTTEGMIKTMVKECISDLGWEFFYLGANVDAFREAGTMGIPQAYAANYRSTASGTENMYAATSKAFSMLRHRSTGAVGGSGGTTMSDLIDSATAEDDDED
jgi:hypothetical protein